MGPNFDVKQFTIDNYLRTWCAVEKSLKKIEADRGLGQALLYLYSQQEFQGIVRGPSETRSESLLDPLALISWIALIQPHRAARNGVGAAPVAPGTANAGIGVCALCPRDIAIASAWSQLGFEFDLTGQSRWIAWANIWPIFRPAAHLVVSSIDHVSQALSPSSSESGNDVRDVIDALCEIVTRAPSCAVYRNDFGAGSSVNHAHFHLYHRDAAFDLPLETLMSRLPDELVTVVSTPLYPLTCVRFRGTPSEITSLAAAFLISWLSLDTSQSNRANLFAGSCGSGKVDLILVPRTQHLEGSRDLIAGAFGTCECMGAFVLTSERDLQALRDHRISAASIRKALASIQPPHIDRFIDDFIAGHGLSNAYARISHPLRRTH